MINEIDNDLLQLNEIANRKDTLSLEQQNKLIKKISLQPSGLPRLLELLIKRQCKQTIELNYIDGTIFKYLYNSKIIQLQEELNIHFKEGVVKLESANNINYKPLYECLISNNFKTANQLTQKYLNKLAGLHQNNKRQWLYFTDVLSLPTKDLQTIDTLWKIYSAGQFGFSIQRQIWLHSNKNWEKFWHQIGWKINKKNIRYPNEFTWDSTAPTGHLPLSNQLRGVQVLATLFMHPAWQRQNDLK